jgi:hypothetical protein
MTDTQAVRMVADDDLKLIIAHTIIEELRAQHPGIEQIDNERGAVWLPGGSTPQSSGCIVDIHSIAQAVEQQVRATFAPGHTDLMVTPESIDAFLEANPLAAAPSVQPGADRETFTVDELAQEIRRVDGNHDLGAGALAEALTPFIVKKLIAYAALQSVAQKEEG